jgi:hypothetical protein
VIRARSWLLILTAIVAISSWLAISNHCALGATAPETKSAGNECPFHANQPVQPKQATDSPCCKILRATVVNTAKICAHSILDLQHVDLTFARLIVVAPPQISFHSATLDTGPPGKTSFVQLIGGMRTHAPPFLA